MTTLTLLRDRDVLRGARGKRNQARPIQLAGGRLFFESSSCAILLVEHDPCSKGRLRPSSRAMREGILFGIML
jgi:hypothetical protein